MADLREVVLEALGARAVARDRHRPARHAALRHALAVAAVMAGERALRTVQHERDVALRALPRMPARAAVDEVRPAAAVEQHDRLGRVDERVARVGVQRAALLAHVDHPHRRQRPGHRRARAGARGAACGRSRAAASRCRPAAARRPAAPAARRRVGRRSAGRPRACRRRRAPRRARSGRGRSIGANTAERGPMQTRAAPLRRRVHSSWRSPADSLECRTATVSPKRSAKRETICGVRPISGHEHDHAAPAPSAVAAARR